MTTYTYKCLKCGNVFDIEAILKEKEEGSEKLICPECGAKEIKQKFSAVNFMKNIFAGDKKGGCCSGGGVCDISCKPDKNNPGSCGDKKGGSGYCG
ncbi:hypothetical protein A2229_03855 [Candidatus Peregrinibacteria bacterium RIFOXYA2_FULL_33_7]|nr:MAG: hypothetical protein A2229_03855 [Candidatus Peregrinibacteria bacterium RIFOXYA2_FULL_33_7]